MQLYCQRSCIVRAVLCTRGGNNGETSVRYGALGAHCLPTCAGEEEKEHDNDDCGGLVMLMMMNMSAFEGLNHADTRVGGGGGRVKNLNNGSDTTGLTAMQPLIMVSIQCNARRTLMMVLIQPQCNAH